MAAGVARAVPLGVGGGALDDLQPVSFLERQLLLVVRRERVQRHLRGRHYVEHILRHGVRMHGVLIVALFASVVRWKPSSMRLVLSPPPAVVALFENEDTRALGKGELVRLLRLVVVLDDRSTQRVRRLHAPAPGIAAAAHRRTVRGQCLRARALLHLLLNTVKE
ncbi:unnamed protein product [Spodoptera exigua]|nr:unnamed protein product [Spodoptera exigua]